MKPDYSIIPHLNFAIKYLRDCGWTSQKCPLGLLVRARDEIVRLRAEMEIRSLERPPRYNYSSSSDNEEG